MHIKFIPMPSMKLANEKLGTHYTGKWSSQMDREWAGEYNNSLVHVSSRLINHPKFGKIEHATIQIKYSVGILAPNSTKVTTELIQCVKDTLFGENRFAIQVYPKESKLVDIMNIYHIFIFDKHVKDPFVISNEEENYVNTYQCLIENDGENPYLTNVNKYNVKVNILGKEYDTELLKFEIANIDEHVWSRKYQIMQQLCGKDVFGIEDYPFFKQYVKRSKTFSEHEPGRIFVFSPDIDMPFGIENGELDLTTYINRGAYMLNKAECIAGQELHDKYYPGNGLF